MQQQQQPGPSQAIPYTNYNSHHNVVKGVLHGHNTNGVHNTSEREYEVPGDIARMAQMRLSLEEVDDEVGKISLSLVVENLRCLVRFREKRVVEALRALRGSPPVLGASLPKSCTTAHITTKKTVRVFELLTVHHHVLLHQMRT